MTPGIAGLSQTALGAAQVTEAPILPLTQEAGKERPGTRPSHVPGRLLAEWVARLATMGVATAHCIPQEG